jgi:hypothetical protein
MCCGHEHSEECNKHGHGDTKHKNSPAVDDALISFDPWFVSIKGTPRFIGIYIIPRLILTFLIIPFVNSFWLKKS